MTKNILITIVPIKIPGYLPGRLLGHLLGHFGVKIF